MRMAAPLNRPLTTLPNRSLSAVKALGSDCSSAHSASSRMITRIPRRAAAIRRLSGLGASVLSSGLVTCRATASRTAMIKGTRAARNVSQKKKFVPPIQKTISAVTITESISR